MMNGQQSNTVHRLVLTGGPCGGKTTAQARISTVFEQLGWQVYLLPEMATIFLGGGVKNAEMNRAVRYRFQENLMRAMLQVEQTFYDVAKAQDRNALIICDRGFMDAVAYLDSPEDWEELKSVNNWCETEVRDKRYDHVVHMVTAADGAEAFYTTANNAARSETLEMAKEMDERVKRAWVGHPYFDVIDNSTNFDKKINRLIVCVAARMGISLADRFHTSSTKRKWLVRKTAPDSAFPKFEDFDMQHVYLLSPSPDVQTRIRRRRGNLGDQPAGNEFSYQHTLRRLVDGGAAIETHQQLTHRDFEMFATQRDMDHAVVDMRRRCFMYNNDYFQLDTYHLPANCAGLMLLTTYTLRDRQVKLPDFLTVAQEVTDDPAYSMYNLTRKQAELPPPAVLSPRMKNITANNKKPVDIKTSKSQIVVEAKSNKKRRQAEDDQLENIPPQRLLRSAAKNSTKRQ